jgi:hypothetical protein
MPPKRIRILRVVRTLPPIHLISSRKIIAAQIAARLILMISGVISMTSLIICLGAKSVPLVVGSNRLAGVVVNHHNLMLMALTPK